MKAMILKQVGDPENLVLKELPVPEIKKNEVLVQVKAIGINPVDTFVRGNEMALKNILQLNGHRENIILGWDISGIVTETGDAVKELKKGDEVFGMVNFAGYGRAYAEYVAAPEDHLALKPNSCCRGWSRTLCRTNRQTFRGLCHRNSFHGKAGFCKETRRR